MDEIFPKNERFSRLYTPGPVKFSVELKQSKLVFFQICSENEKDTRIEPCNHLICSECLSQWQMKDQSMAPTCPYCRCEIRGTCRILINPFSNKPIDIPDRKLDQIDQPKTVNLTRPLPTLPIEPENDSGPQGADNPAFDYSIDATSTDEPGEQNPAPPIPPRINQRA